MANGQAKTKSTSRLSVFLRAAVPDFILTLAMSVALTFTVSYAFDSAASLRGNAWLEAGICAVLLIVLFAGSWSKRALVPAAVGFAACAAVLVAALGSLGTEPLFTDAGLNDVDGNYALFGFIACGVTLLVYLLSRRGVGVAVLFALGMLACGMVQFLYRDWVTAQPGTAAFAVCLVGVLMMFVYQTYRSSVRNAARVKRTSFAAVAGTAAGICAVCVALAFGVYFALIAPLNLSTVQIKLFQDTYQRPVIEYTGVYSEQAVDNPDITTNHVNDNALDTNQDAAGGSLADESSTESSDNPITGIAQQLQAFSADNWAEQFETIGYETVVTTMLWVLLVVAVAVAVAVFLRLRHRARWIDRVREQAPVDQVDAVYNRLTRSFARVGISRPPALTPLEYALTARYEYAPFDRNTGGLTFVQATLIYQRVVYGAGNVSEDDAAALRRYYQAFPDNARAFVGKLRWLTLFWRV